jgi:cellulose synthase/poly-beta-1,6-N-acetylglucosamine synthase-like glycosyltransferase
MLKTIDTAIIETIENMLRLANDWLSITQRMIERAVIRVCLLLILSVWLCSIPITWKVVYTLGALLVVAEMFREHRLPRSSRAVKRRTQRFYRFYLLVITFIVVPLLMLLPPYSWLDCAAFGLNLLEALFYFVLVAVVDGEPGRARKLSIQELTRIFGVEWVPQPARIF